MSGTILNTWTPWEAVYTWVPVPQKLYDFGAIIWPLNAWDPNAMSAPRCPSKNEALSAP